MRATNRSRSGRLPLSRSLLCNERSSRLLKPWWLGELGYRWSSSGAILICSKLLEKPKEDPIRCLSSHVERDGKRSGYCRPPAAPGRDETTLGRQRCRDPAETTGN